MAIQQQPIDAVMTDNSKCVSNYGREEGGIRVSPSHGGVGSRHCQRHVNTCIHT